MRRFIKYLTIFLALILILCIGAAISASYLFDKKVNDVLNKFNAKQNKLELKYESKAHTLLTKSGYLYLKALNTPLGTISTCFDLELDFSLHGVEANFTKLSSKGNLDDLLKKYSIPPLQISGNARFDPAAVKGSFNLDIKGFEYPLEDGVCAVSNQKISAKNSSLSQVLVSYNTDGIKCKASTLYNTKPAFLVFLENLKLDQKINIDKKNKTFSISDTSLLLDKFLFDISTLYAIGFAPEDEVLDKSLRDRFEINSLNIKTNLKALKNNNYKLNFVQTSSLSFAFPYIKDNELVKGYDFSNVHTEFETGLFNISKIKEILKKGQYSDLITAISQPFTFDLKDFSFDLNKRHAFVSGKSEIYINNPFELKDVNLDFYLEGDKKLIDEYLSKEYVASFNKMLSQGLVLRHNDNYKTHFEFKNKIPTFNGLNMDLSSDEDEDLQEIEDISENN